MRLSRWAYHADFVVYPVLVTVAILRSPWTPRLAAADWLVAAGAGLLAWTAIEYALHRWVLHRVEPFRRLHAAHHAQPCALIGTPTWLSAALFLGAWGAVAQAAPAPVANGAAAGLMTGYFVYAFIHDAVHHRRARPGSWLHRAKCRHAQHHRAGASCNFGVSTGWWDAILGSSATPPRASGVAPHGPG